MEKDNNQYNSRLYGPSLSILFLIPSIAWIIADRAVWPWDPSWYAEGSLNLWQTLQTDILHWPIAAVRVFDIKAPGIAWIGQFFSPIGELIDSFETGLLLSIVTTQGISLYLIHTAVCQLTRERIASLASLAALASTPMFIALTHLYFAEPLQLSAVCYMVWIAARSPTTARWETLAHLGLCLAIGMSAKASTPIYLWGFSALALWNALRTPDKSSKPHIFLALLSLFSITITAAWYLLNWESVVEFVRSTSSGSIATQYGKRSDILTKIQFWSDALIKSAGATVWITLALTATSIVIFVYKKKRSALAPLDFLAIAGASQLICALTLFSLNINEETRYILPIIPSLLIVLSWSIQQFSIAPRMVALVSSAICVAQAAYIHAIALGFQPFDPRITHWVIPVTRDNDRFANMTNMISATCTDFGTYSMIGIEETWLNANNAQFFSAKNALIGRPSCKYTSLGYAETDFERSWARIDQFNIKNFITLDDDSQITPGIFNATALYARTRIRESADFKLTAKFGHIEVYSRK